MRDRRASSLEALPDKWAPMACWVASSTDLVASSTFSSAAVTWAHECPATPRHVS